MSKSHDDIFGAHRGVKTTYEKIKERYFLVNMYKEVENYCATCQECFTHKLHPEIKGPLCPIECNYAIEKVGVDLMGPLPESSSGMKYILVFIIIFYPVQLFWFNI